MVRITRVAGPWLSFGVHVDVRKGYADFHLLWWIITVGRDYYPDLKGRLCAIRECDRRALPELRLCGPCRLAYLNGVIDGTSGKQTTTLTDLCAACGHFEHKGTPCGWHGGTCDDAFEDPALWCACDGTHPRGRAVEARPRCWVRVPRSAAEEAETDRRAAEVKARRRA